MKPRKQEWLGIEGWREGYPVMWRLRHLNPKRFQRNRPILFVVTWSYPAHRPTQLPLNSFYARLEKFEEEAIDQVETRCGAVFVGTETGLGKCHYFFYTKSSDDISALLDSVIDSSEHVEFSAKKDPRWSEYGRLAALAE